MKHSRLQPTVIEGENYYTVSQFAQLVGAWPSRISLLVNAEREDRRIPSIRLADRPFIHERELQLYVSYKYNKELLHV